MRFPEIVGQSVVLAGLLAVGLGYSEAHAQGSIGGTIGKTDKSMSGTESPEPPVSLGKPGSAARRAPPRGGSASVSAFDGVWTFVATGCGAGAKQGVISGGKISIGDGGGQVGANGAMRCSFTTMSGVTQVAVGRLSGMTGAGTYSRPNGCSGRWTARKQ